MFFRNFTFILPVWIAMPSLAAQGLLTDWLPQINFRPLPALQTALMNRPAVEAGGIWHFQKIEAGTGPLCTDYFGFSVVKFPKVAGREMKPVEFLQWSRTHMGDFLDPALASCQTDGFEDQWRWESAAASPGAVVRVKLLTADPPGSSCLAVTDQNAAYFVLSTVHPSATGFQDWPVSGNRWIGLAEGKSTSETTDEPARKHASKKSAAPAPPAARAPWIFYTRGAWRARTATDPAKIPAVIAREEALWKSYTGRLQAFIKEHGGGCGPAPVPSGTYQQDWEPVHSSKFAPFTSWVDPEGSWTSTDKNGRFRLVVHPGFKTCDFTERSSSGKELQRTAIMQPAGTSEGWKIERSSIEPEVLDFLGFDAAAAAQISAAAPGPSYLVFTRKGPVLKAKWHGFIVERDGQGAVAAVKAPGASRPKEYDFAPTRQAEPPAPPVPLPATPAVPPPP